MITKNESVASDTTDHLITQYYHSSNLKSVLETIGDEVQVIENISHSMYINRMLEDAIGIQLDRLGGIVGRVRDGLSDSDYRIRIKAKIAENNSEGTRPEILALCRLLLPDSIPVIQESIASYIITFVSDSIYSGNWSDIQEALTNATVSGVGVTVQESNTTVFALGPFSTTHADGVERAGLDNGKLAGLKT